MYRTASPSPLELAPPASSGPAPALAVAPVPARHRVREALRRYGLFALLAVFGIALIPWGAPRLLYGPRIDVDPVIRRDFVQSVVASGHVEAPHRVSIGTQVVGTARSVPVQEGQVVREGQVLVALDSAELEATAAQADAAVLQAQARIRQLREVQAPIAEQAMRQARINLANAQAQQRRNAELARQGFIGQAALDDFDKVVSLAQAQLISATSQLATTRADGSDYAVAATALAQARASAQAAHARLSYASIVAPVAGTLIDRAVEPGDVVQPGKALMVLSPSGATQLVVQIDEKNLQLLAPGQAALVSADAYADQRFAAMLVYINPGVDVQRGSVEVKLDVPQPPAYLRQDMTVSVDIQVASRHDAVLVPTQSVRQAERGQPWVLKVDGHRARRQPIRLGMRSGSMSEVLEGLQPGDLVVPAAANGIVEGSRLRGVPARPAP
ncbi:efflux RND transporter periplasmic adaptor subunit [Variovorax humicola]|uniref:Efflux RND transporter periplasmic adaptor subunit n=1 Tax=Variovorax humicola TaxID=1769758 RepID=A0ABU8WAC9_9BURK